MPVYEYLCRVCGNRSEKIACIDDSPPECCGTAMSRTFSGSVAIRDSRSLTGKRNELWINRLDDIHKRQADKGERLRLPHPKEVLT